MARGRTGPQASPAAAYAQWITWVDAGDLMPAGTDTVVERERVQ